MKKILFLGLFLLSSVSFLLAQVSPGTHNTQTNTNYAATLGDYNTTTAMYSLAGGSNSIATGIRSFAFGYMVGATANNAVIFGSHNEEVMARFENNIPNSFMIGFNTWRDPSFFVESFDKEGKGGGFVGIHTTTPRSTLDVAGTLTVDDFVMNDGGAEDRVLTYGENGLAYWGTLSGGGVTTPFILTGQVESNADGDTWLTNEAINQDSTTSINANTKMIVSGVTTPLSINMLTLQSYMQKHLDFGSNSNPVVDGVWQYCPNKENIFYGEGSVGIGTNIPEESLHTTGSVLAEEGFKLRGDVNIIEFGGSAASKFHIVNGEHATPNYAFTIDANDKIGIGKNIPEEKLHVGGNIKVEQSVMAIGSVSADANMISKGFFLNDNTNSIHYFGKAGFPSTYSLIKKVGSSPGKSSEDVTILKVGADNNIGIGTTSLGAKLDVNGDVLIREGLEVEMDVLVQENLDVNGDVLIREGLEVKMDVLVQENLDVNGYAQINGDAQINGELDFTTGLNQISFGEISTPKTLIIRSNYFPGGKAAFRGLVISSMGNVGIGIDNPSESLEVNGDVLVRDSLKVDGNLLVQENLEVIGTTKTEGFQMTGGEAGNGKVLQSDDDGVASWVDVNTITAADPWTESDGNVFRSSGYVGVGISPEAPLHIKASTTAPGFQFNSVESEMDYPSDFEFKAIGGDNFSTMKIINMNHSADYSWNCGAAEGVGEEDENEHYFVEGLRLQIRPWKDPTTGYFNSTKLHLNGRMGINTPVQPGHTLSVNGTIGCKKVVVTISDDVWPDYVFEDDYKLPKLKDIEAFVKENNHLPGVPSAEEICEDDLDLGAMNVILLQKIEELTLLMIEQNKSIEQQQKEIDALKEKSNQ